MARTPCIHLCVLVLRLWRDPALSAVLLAARCVCRSGVGYTGARSQWCVVAGQSTTGLIPWFSGLNFSNGPAFGLMNNAVVIQPCNPLVTDAVTAFWNSWVVGELMHDVTERVSVVASTGLPCCACCF
jgi:hypothetical protein